MTGPEIPDEAVRAFTDEFRRAGAWGGECVRAGLAAALPHLAEALRAPLPDPASATSNLAGSWPSDALSGPQGHPASNPSPPETIPVTPDQEAVFDELVALGQELQVEERPSA